MKSNSIKDKFHIAKHYCLSVITCILLLSAVWFGVWFDSLQAAIATPINDCSQQLIATNPWKGMGDKDKLEKADENTIDAVKGFLVATSK